MLTLWRLECAPSWSSAGSDLVGVTRTDASASPLPGAGLLGIGVVTYSAWLLEFVLPTGISPVQQPAEQLLSAQPVFHVALGVSGLAFTLASPPLLRLPPVHCMARMTASSLCAFGIALLGDVARPGTTALPLLANSAALVGALSLVLWWPPGWRAWPAVFLALVVLALGISPGCSPGPRCWSAPRSSWSG